MKKISLFIGALALLPGMVWGSIDTNIKGEIQVIASDVRQNASSWFNSGTNFRVLSGIESQLTQDVRANLLFQYVNAWGNGGAASSNWGTSGGNIQNYLDIITLAEANIVIDNLFSSLEITLGRQFYGDESSAVMYFGPTHYISESMGASSLDAAKAVWGNDRVTVTVIAGKAVYLAPLYGNNATEEKNSTFYGMDMVFPVLSALQAQIYAYNLRNVQIALRKGNYSFKNAGLYGAKLNYSQGNLTLTAEYARNFHGNTLFSEEKADAGYMFKGDASYTMDTDLFALKPRGTFIYSADMFRAHGNYSAGIFIGDNYGDIFTYFGNYGVKIFNIGLDIQPKNLSKWTFLLDGYSLQDRFGRTAPTYEGDLIVKYAHNSQLELFAGVAYVKNGTLQRGGVKKNPLVSKDKLQGQLGILFQS